jgi:hypothetical protein
VGFRLEILQVSRVQAPVHIFLDDLALSVCSLDFRPTDALDGLLAIEIAVEVLCEYEVLPQVFETKFQCPFEHLRLWKAASLRDFPYSVGNFGGYTV